MRWALDSFQPYKSPGPDGIYPILLTKALEAVLPELVTLYRASVAMGYIPKAWRIAKVVFLPKAGKKDMRRSWTTTSGVPH